MFFFDAPFFSAKNSPLFQISDTRPKALDILLLSIFLSKDLNCSTFRFLLILFRWSWCATTLLSLSSQGNCIGSLNQVFFSAETAFDMDNLLLLIQLVLRIICNKGRSEDYVDVVHYFECSFVFNDFKMTYFQ